MSLINILQKYVGIKLFEEDQQKFKEEFFKELFDPYIKVDYTKRSTLFINSVLEEEKLPYIFAVRKEELDCINKGKKYWILIEL